MVSKIKNVIVGLSHTAPDTDLIKYASFLADATEVEHIYFVNVVNLQIPKEVLAEFPNLKKEAMDERIDEVEDLIKANWHPENTIKHTVEVIQSSNKLKGLLKAIAKFDADLIVIGRIKDKPKQSIITQRLARRAPCQLLIVPQGIYETANIGRQIKTLLVPIDFSKYAVLALERAIAIARRNEHKHKIEIVCQHVFQLPSGYHLSGKNEEEFAELMCENAKDSYKRFLSEIDTKGVNIRVVYSRDINDDLTSDIRDLAMEIDADGIIIGSKGRTATAALFLGSFAENLITNTTNFTLMVVRKKKDFDGILDRLKKL